MAPNNPRHAWLTPDTEDALADLLCRRFFVPDSPAFRESVSGALLELTYSWNWEQYGTMTPDETALAMLEMYNRYALDSACDYNAPAPYWDDEDASDADDTELITTEDWYGGVTYTESGVPVFAGNRLENWLIAGFVAVVAGKDKAVRFLTATKQFDLYFRTGDWGGAVNVFLNGVLAVLVDTYSASPGLKRVPVLTNGAPAMGMGSMDAPVEMLIVQGDHHDGVSTPQLQIVRKRLWAGELVPENTRYNSACDCVQITYDDGATWHDRPDADPRHGTIYLMPPQGDPCNAAANMVKWLHDFIDQVIDLLFAGSVLIAVVNKLLDFLVLLTEGAALLIELILDIADTLFGLGAAALALAFTSTEYDALLCIFYCNIGGDGSVSADQLAIIESAVTAQLNTTAALVTNLLLGIQGEVGLQNAGAIGSETGDCSGCACSTCAVLYDFTLGDQLGWYLALNAWYSCFPLGSWSGTGWDTTADACNPGSNAAYIAIDCTNPAFDVVGFKYTASADGVVYVYLRNASGGYITELGNQYFTSGTDVSVSITGLGAVYTGDYIIQVGATTTGSFTLSKLHLGAAIP